MNSLIHADIFFFISSIALVVISIAILIALIYIILILKKVFTMTNNVKAESEKIIKDIEELRGSIKNEGFKLRTMSKFLGGIFSSRKRKE